MNNQLKVSLENIIPLTEARDHFSQIVAEVQKDKLYVLTKGGKPAVAIIDVKYLEALTGGEISKENVRAEIKKAPEKVGLPPIIEHNMNKPTPPPLPNQPPVNRGQSPQGTVPLPPPSKPEPPKPAGFAAPQSPPPPISKPTPPPISIPHTPPPTPPPVANGPAPLKMPGEDDTTKEKIDVQLTQEPPSEDKKRTADIFHSPDDKNPPAQYAGKGDDEPEDMALD